MPTETLTPPPTEVAPSSTYLDSDNPANHAATSQAQASTYLDSDNPANHVKSSEAPIKDATASTYLDPDNPSNAGKSSTSTIEPVRPQDAGPSLPDDQYQSQYSSRGFQGLPDPEKQIASATATPNELTQGSNTVPNLTLGSGPKPISFIDQQLDKSLADSAAAAVNQQRIDTTVNAPDAPATPQQLQTVIDSHKDVWGLAAQDVIGKNTAIAAANHADEVWDNSNPWQKAGIIGQGFWNILSGSVQKLGNVVAGEFDPVMEGALKGQFTPGPVVKSVGGLVKDVGELATMPENVDKNGSSGYPGFPVEINKPGFEYTQAVGQPQPQLGINPDIASTDATPAQVSAQEAERQKAQRELLSAGGSLLQTGRDMAQGLIQNTSDAASALNLPRSSVPINPITNLGGGFVVRNAWNQLSDAQKREYADLMIKQRQEEGRTSAGQDDYVNSALQMLAQGSGHHIFTQAEQKAMGTDPDPGVVSLGSLALQAALTHGLGEVPGIDAAIDGFSNLALNAPRIATWTPGLALKGLSAAAKNQKFMGTLGGINGVLQAANEVLHGNFSPQVLSAPFFEAKTAQGIARSGLLSKGIDLAATPINYMDRVLATAAAEAADGNSWFSTGLKGVNPSNWNIPDWLQPPTMEGSMSKAGGLTRAIAAPLASGVKAAVSAAPFAATTQSQEEAADLEGNMMALGTMGGIPRGVTEGMAAPFSHLFVPKYDPLLDWGKAKQSDYFNYGTDKDLDAVAKQTISQYPPDLQNRINDLRSFLKGKAEVYPVGNDSFQNIFAAKTANDLSQLDQQIATTQFNQAQAMANGDVAGARSHAADLQDLQNRRAIAQADPAAAANARGYFFSDGIDGNGPRQAFIRADKIGDALNHDGFGHPAWAMMQQYYPEHAAAFLNAAKATTNMDKFTNDYVRRFTNGGITDATYAQPNGIFSPDFNIDQPGSGNRGAGRFQQSDIDDELAAEHAAGMLDGADVSTWTKNASLQRSFVMGLGSVLERVLGVPITGAYDRHEFGGFNSSIIGAVKMDQALRMMSKDPNTIRPWEAKTEAPPPPSRSTGGQTGGTTRGGSPSGPPPTTPTGAIDEDLVKAVMRSGFSRPQALQFLAKAQAQGGLPASPNSAGSTGTQPTTQPSGASPQAPQTLPSAPQSPSTESRDDTAPLQKVLRENGLNPAEAQQVATGTEPMANSSLESRSGTSGKPRGGAGPGAARGVGKDMPGKTGYFGYAGDLTPDDNSLRGIGAFHHSSKAGSMISGYSAGLTDEGARMRNVVPGQEFYVNNVKYRYDDRVPSHPIVNGKVVNTPVDYVDIFDRSRSPDRGVSADQIARDRRIIASVENSGERGDKETGESLPSAPMTGGGSSSSAPTPEKASTTEPQESKATEPTKPEVTKEDVDKAKQQAAATIEQGKKSDAAHAAAILNDVIQRLGTQHADSLADGDTRVTLQPSGFIGGTHFVTDGSDEFHNFLLSSLDPAKREQQVQLLNQVQPAIEGRKDIFADYHSAPQKEAGISTGSQRQEAQSQSTSADRAKALAGQQNIIQAGKGLSQPSGKNLVPSWVGFARDESGPYGHIVVGGSSPEKISENAQMLQNALGPRSPYPIGGPINTGAAEQDLAGALWNQNAGWKLDGSARLTPTPGNESSIPSEPEGFTPYKIPNKAKADFWNAAMGQGSGGKMSENAKRAPKAAAAFEMARANQGFAEGGYTNPLLRSIDLAHPVEGGKTWSQRNLHSPWETLDARLLGKIHPSGESASESIHASHPAVAAAIEAKGTPKNFASRAGFLPGESKPELSTEDQIKKNGHMIAGLERKQKQLDLDDPKESDKWDELQVRIHDLEDEAEKLRAAPVAKGKASFMPGETAGAQTHEVEDAKHQWLAKGTDSPYFKKWFGKSKVTDESGKPRVVYHGTNVGFDQFETGRGSNTGAKSGLEGHFFSSEPDEAQQYGEVGITGRMKELTAQMEALREQSEKDVNEKGFDFDRVMLAQERYSALEAQRQAIHDEARQTGDHLVAAQGSNIMPAYLRMENPLEVDMKGETRPQEGEFKPMIAKAKAEGRDGVILRNTYDQVFDSGKPDYGTSDIFMPFDSKQVKSATGNRGTFDRQSSKVSFMPGAIEKPKWDEASEETRQKYLRAKVKQTLANQHKDPATVPLKVLKKEDGGIQYDPQGNPVYEPGDYDIANSPMLGKKALAKIANADIHSDELGTEQHPYLNQVERKRLSALREVSAVNTFGDKIVDSYNKVKDQPAIAAGKSWYSTMRQKLLNALGPHNEIFAQLLGATSAKTPVRSNFIQALDAYEQWLKGMKDPSNMKLGFNRHIAKYLEAYNKMQEGEGSLSQHMRKQGIIPKDENGNDTEHVSEADALGHWIAHHDILPKQQNGKKFNSNSNAVLKVLAGTWLKEVGAPKTPNFAGNLTGRTLEATIDVWAARHLKQLGYEGFTNKPWRHQPAAEQGVSALDFAFSQDAMRNAADKLGIDPDSLQATLWFAQKQYHQSRGWTRGEGAKKSSFDDVFDKVFAKSGEPMTAADARAHYQAVSEAEAKLKARIKTAQDIQANRPHKLDAYLTKHGMSKEVLAHAGDTTEDEGE
jgi:ADP-Ribosyltransferase in polyvalent proteins